MLQSLLSSLFLALRTTSFDNTKRSLLEVRLSSVLLIHCSSLTPPTQHVYYDPAYPEIPVHTHIVSLKSWYVYNTFYIHTEYQGFFEG